MPPPKTARLTLRPLALTDAEAFVAMNADAEVMAHFPSPLSRADSDAMLDKIVQAEGDHGYSFWAVDVESGAIEGIVGFVGFVGLNLLGYEVPGVVAPAVEVGWRLARRAWGHGIATEAGVASLAYSFGTLRHNEVVSFTGTSNRASRAVMERIGMRRDVDGDFDHPRLPAGHRLSRHVLYRASAEAWTSQMTTSPGP